MSKSNYFENAILAHVFNNAAITNIGDAPGLLAAATPGSVFVGLFTAVTDGEASTVTEATYGGYARKAVARSGAGWTVSGNQASNAAAITFDEATSGSETISHFGVYDALSGGNLLYYAAVTTPRLVAAGVTLEYGVGALTVTED